MKNQTSFQHNRITLTTISGSGILIPLKNGFLEKISTWRGNRSPAAATRHTCILGFCLTGKFLDIYHRSPVILLENIRQLLEVYFYRPSAKCATEPTASKQKFKV